MKDLPNINLFYWTLMLSANTIGETAGDLISQTFQLGYGAGTLVLISLLLIALVFSLFSKKHHPILYWTLITLCSTTGTTIADYFSRSIFHLQFGYTENQGYTFSVIFLMAIFLLTYRFWKQGNQANEIIQQQKTVFFYWMTILVSSTLGTAIGDMLAHNTGIGYAGGTVLLLLLLSLVVLLKYLSKISNVLLYWFAIVIMHPIGATLGDYFTKPEGLNFGNVHASEYLLLVFITIVSIGELNKKYKMV
jgi:uncharacterized membrane-anchored protein